MFKKWLYRTTPFVLLAVFATVVILYQTIVERGGPEGWKYPLILRLFFFLLVVIAVDLLLKFRTGLKTYLIWIIEIFLCLGFLYYWIVS